MSDVESRLAEYTRLLLAYNENVNLTAARTPEAVALHIADSLTLAPYVASPHVDIGSGGGFPAIPLAIACGIEVTLIESVAKKAKFLDEILGQLGLRGRIITARAEDVGRDPLLRGHFASASARAVATLPTVMELAIPLLTVGGLALLQRGQLSESERQAAHDAALVLEATVGDEIVVANGERRIVIVTKRQATPQRFPRKSRVPGKRPLCIEPER